MNTLSSLADISIPLLISMAAAGFVVLAVFFVFRLAIKLIKNNPADFAHSVLLVTVPKESSDAADQEESIEKIRSQIGVAESWFATLGGLRAQRGIDAWLFGRTDHFSLEMVLQNGVISFYVSVPHYLKDYMEHQIVSQYPEANVTEVSDYNIFKPTSHVVAGYLRLGRTYIFPLKTYEKMNTDPLNAITGALSKVQEADGVAIQIIARSAHKRWHRKGVRVAREAQKGKPITKAIAESKFLSWYKIVNFFRIEKPNDQQQKPTNLSPMEQEQIKGIEEKTAKAGLDCNIRIVASADTEISARNYLNSVMDSFSQYNYYQYGNTFKFKKVAPEKLVKDYIYRRFSDRQKILLNTEELASIYHLPTPFLDTPNILWLLAKQLPAPPNLPQEGLLIGENIYRGQKTDVYIQPEDRRRHWYIIGMTGTGKSALMANCAIQDIRDGHGVCVIDPHGSLVEDILPAIPTSRINDVIYFNPSDVERPIGLNMLEAETEDQKDFVVQEMIAIFYKLVTDPSMIGPIFEHQMRNAMLTLMSDKQNPGTIAELPRIFTDKKFLDYKLQFVTDPMVRAFWEQEMAKTSDFHKSETLGYLISKVGRFVENAMIRNIIGQPKSGFNFRDIMDNKKILLVNLAKGTTGEVNSNLLGLILVAKLQMAALSRTNIPEHERKDFYLYIDEFQNFITDSISTILAEARKYKLDLILAHQYIGQLTEGTGPEGKSYGNKIKDAIFGNVGTITSFRIGVEDAELMAKQFAPVVDEYDLMNIERFNAYVRLLVNNQPYKAFNMHTFPPIKGDDMIVSKIKDFSRSQYGARRGDVERDIIERSQLGIKKANAIEPPLERSR